MAAVGGPVATAAPKDDVWLGTAVLASAAAEAAVRDDRAGAVSTFVGTTRGTFDGKVVVRLEYEAYEAMAYKQLAALCHTVRVKHPDVLHMAVHHRLGVVAVGEASVVIAVSSAHRRDAIGRFGEYATKGEWDPLRVDGHGGCARAEWQPVVLVEMAQLTSVLVLGTCSFSRLAVGPPIPWMAGPLPLPIDRGVSFCD